MLVLAAAVQNGPAQVGPGAAFPASTAAGGVRHEHSYPTIPNPAPNAVRNGGDAAGAAGSGHATTAAKAVAILACPVSFGCRPSLRSDIVFTHPSVST